MSLNEYMLTLGLTVHLSSYYHAERCVALIVFKWMQLCQGNFLLWHCKIIGLSAETTPETQWTRLVWSALNGNRQVLNLYWCHHPGNSSQPAQNDVEPFVLTDRLEYRQHCCHRWLFYVYMIDDYMMISGQKYLALCIKSKETLFYRLRNGGHSISI